MLAQREAEHKYGPIPPLSRVEILTAPPDRATVASPAESIYDDDDEEPGLEGRGAATKRKFDDAIIQQRMEEDRERVRPPPLPLIRLLRTDVGCQHKRLRENIWAIGYPDYDGQNPEFDRSWDQQSDLNSDDYEMMREENQILAASVA